MTILQTSKLSVTGYFTENILDGNRIFALLPNIFISINKRKSYFLFALDWLFYEAGI